MMMMMMTDYRLRQFVSTLMRNGSARGKPRRAHGSFTITASSHEKLIRVIKVSADTIKSNLRLLKILFTLNFFRLFYSSLGIYVCAVGFIAAKLLSQQIKR